MKKAAIVNALGNASQRQGNRADTRWKPAAPADLRTPPHQGAAAPARRRGAHAIESDRAAPRRHQTLV